MERIIAHYLEIVKRKLGTFKLNRTKYYDKANKRYFCLLDEKINIPAYEHMAFYRKQYKEQ